MKTSKAVNARLKQNKAELVDLNDTLITRLAELRTQARLQLQDLPPTASEERQRITHVRQATMHQEQVQADQIRHYLVIEAKVLRWVLG